MTNATYTFEATNLYEFHDSKVHHAGGRGTTKGHRRGRSSSSADNNQQHQNDGDHSSCAGSLTYSATSSVNSGTADSTDSSFADIMKVLDAQDGKDLASYLRGSSSSLRRNDEKSVAESLAYSTDADTYMRSLATDGGESHLRGTDLLSQSNSVQPEDAPNNNSSNNFPAPEDNDPFADNIFFAPAEHTESIKQRKERKRQERQQRKAAKDQEKMMASQQQQQQHRSSSRSSSGGYHENEKPANRGSKYSHNVPPAGVVPPDPTKLESRQGTPPMSSMPRDREGSTTHNPHRRPPKSRSTSTGGNWATREDRDAPINLLEGTECDIWYAKWWLFCFPDAVDTMTERR